MFRRSIRRKIVGIALGLVVLMVATSILSTIMAGKVGHLLDELSNKYIPAYGHLPGLTFDHWNEHSLFAGWSLRKCRTRRTTQPMQSVSAFINKSALRS